MLPDVTLPVMGTQMAAQVAVLAEIFAAPVMLLAIIAAHVLYYFMTRGSDGQQVIALSDLTDLNPGKCASLRERLTLVEGWGHEYDARSRGTTRAQMMMPLRSFGVSSGATAHHADSQRIADCVVRTALICAEDLVVDGSTQFLGPLKVGGDLVVRGVATFSQAVVVNGVLKVEGEAQFALGVLAKGDTFVSGSLTIGSDCGEGWAALRHFALGKRLCLNGRLVSARAIQLKAAA